MNHAPLPEPIEFPLPEKVRQELNGLTKTENKTRKTQKKAEHIVRLILRHWYGERAQIEEDREGVDLKVTIDGEHVRIEVKGTDSDNILGNLVVSSQKCHDALVSGDAVIYRVVNVNSEKPGICILEHGKHFTLEPEPRWSVKRIPPDNERYPLRGMPYRYDRPHDPVALEDWEILQ